MRRLCDAEASLLPEQTSRDEVLRFAEWREVAASCPSALKSDRLLLRTFRRVSWETLHATRCGHLVRSSMTAHNMGEPWSVVRFMQSILRTFLQPLANGATATPGQDPGLEHVTFSGRCWA